MKKKVLRIFAIVLLLFVALLFAIPLFLQAKFADILKNKVNQNINATLDFEDAQLSLIKSFPNAYMGLKEVSLVNKVPFEGDTLFAADAVALDMSLTELFKSADEPIAIKKLVLDGAKVHIHVNAEGNANYDIAKESGADTEAVATDASDNFLLNLESYEINNATIAYDDVGSGMHLLLSEMYHSGTGNLSLEKSELDTKTNAYVSFQMDSIKYLNNNTVALDALVGIDLAENKYSFLENKAMVNQLPLVFDGFVKVNEDNQEVDITFTTPSSDFKNFLAVVPEAYATNLDGVKTTGNFEVDGEFKGIVDEEHIPAFAIKINSQNASFKYPDLPKAVEQVFIDAEINNETGITEDTYVAIDRLSFQIDGDKFNLNSKIQDLLGNTKVNLHADGAINLANLSNAYPMPEDYGLSGLLSADFTTTFDMASLENHQYQNTQTNGQASLTGFHYQTEELKNPVAISKAALTFNPTTVSLDAFEGKSGQTDFKASGTLTNLLGYVFNDENIEGHFALESNTFAVSDFMVAETLEDGEAETTPQTSERIKIPSFLDCTIDAVAQTVYYDDLILKDVSGRLLVKDETVILENLTSSIFDGTLGLNGSVSTKEEISTFDLGMGIDGFKISESFQAMAMFKVLAPVANALQGRLNSDIKFSGNLDDDMTPSLGSLSGDLLAELLSAELSTKNATMLTALDNQLDFIKLRELDLKDVKTTLSFDDGKVNVKPFTLDYKDIAIEVSGSHTFDMQLQYQAKLDVPAKYLGDEVTGLLAQLNDESLNDLTLPVIANIGGTYTNPKVNTDLSSGVKDLTSRLVEIQKQKLLNQGKDKAKDLIGGLLGGDKTDSTETTGSGVAEALGSLLGGKKRDSVQTDTIQQQNAAETAAKSILGGLLGKKKDTAKQQ